MTERPVRWAIVGTGTIARRVGADIASLPDAQIVGVQSRGARVDDDFRRQVADVPVFGDAAGLVDDAAPDIAYVATPHALHAGAAHRYLDAGVAVLVEKPLTISAAETRDLVGHAAASGLLCVEAVWTRFNPAVLAWRDAITAEEIGTPHTLTAAIGFDFSADEMNRVWTPGLGGGATLEVASYPIALAVMLFGPPETVQAAGSIGRNGLDESATVTLTWDEGRTAELRYSLAEVIASDAVVTGTTGRARLAAPFQRSQALIVEPDGGHGRSLMRPLDGNGFRPMLREVHARLRAGHSESPLMPHVHSVVVATVMDEILRQLCVQPRTALQPAPPSSSPLGAPPATSTHAERAPHVHNSQHQPG